MTIATAKPRRRTVDPIEALWGDLFKPVHNHSYNVSPAFNILEWDDKFEIDLAVPGFEKSDFIIKLEDDHLLIELNKEEEKTEGVKVRRRGFNFGNFKKRFHLSDDIDQTSVKATYESGILKVELQKKEEAKKPEPRSIEIL